MYVNRQNSSSRGALLGDAAESYGRGELDLEQVAVAERANAALLEAQVRLYEVTDCRERNANEEPNRSRPSTMTTWNTNGGVFDAHLQPRSSFEAMTHDYSDEGVDQGYDLALSVNSHDTLYTFMVNRQGVRVTEDNGDIATPTSVTAESILGVVAHLLYRSPESLEATLASFHELEDTYGTTYAQSFDLA